MRVLHSTLPLLASRPCTTPDFWPTTSRRSPFGSVTSIGGDPKSKSGPLPAGQFAASTPPQARFQASPLVSWLTHLIAPELRSSAMIASLVGAAGDE